MSWYLALLISCAWLVTLFEWNYVLAGRIQASNDDPLIQVVSLIGHFILFASWPILALAYQVIDATWYGWALIAIDVACLFFLIPIIAERAQETKPGFFHGRSVIEATEKTVAIAVCMALAPLGLWAMFCFE